MRRQWMSRCVMTLSITGFTLCTPLPKSSHLALSGVESQRPASSISSGLSNGSNFITAPLLLDPSTVNLAIRVPRQAVARLPPGRHHVGGKQGAECATETHGRYGGA